MPTTGGRLCSGVGLAEAGRRKHLGAAIRVARVEFGKTTGLHGLRTALKARHPPCVAMVAVGMMMFDVMAGLGMPPCTMVGPCRSRRDERDD
jgi:hypothetical protein